MPAVVGRRMASEPEEGSSAVVMSGWRRSRVWVSVVSVGGDEPTTPFFKVASAVRDERWKAPVQCWRYSLPAGGASPDERTTGPDDGCGWRLVVRSKPSKCTTPADASATRGTMPTWKVPTTVTVVHAAPLLISTCASAGVVDEVRDTAPPSVAATVAHAEVRPSAVTLFGSERVTRSSIEKSRVVPSANSTVAISGDPEA